MRKIILFSLLLVATTNFNASAQVKIGNNPNTVNNNSLLELESTNKGLLLPRLTTAQINAMNNVPKGMIVFNTTDSSLYLKRDSGWSIVPIASNADSKTLYWAKSGNNIVNTNSGRVDIISNDGIVAKGTYLGGNDLTESGGGSKLIWYPKKAAFRAGNISSDYWDKDSIGVYSIAAGYNVKAKGQGSVSLGFSNEAIAGGSVALGWSNKATGASSIAAGFNNESSGSFAVSIGSNHVAWGENSTAIGYGDTALGHNSIAMGYKNVATGEYTTAIGYRNVSNGLGSFACGTSTKSSGFYTFTAGYASVAKSFACASFGEYNDTSDISVDYPANDRRIFQIGNGISNNRTNALTILKNGNVGINVLSPSSKLELRGTLGFSSTTKRWELNYDSTNNYFYADEFGTGRHLVIKNGGNVGIGNTNPSEKLVVNGNILVQNNKGLIRSNDATQLKKLSHSVTVNASFAAGETKQFNFTWSETFSAIPEAYVGNAASGGGFAEVVMTLGNISTTGGTLYVYNPRTSTANPNFTVKVLGI